jgi:hypothetical protein
MATSIQLKRALTFEGTADEAIARVKELSGDNALKVGEPMIVRFREDSGYRFMLVTCTAVNPTSLTIYPAFENLTDFANYIKSIVPSSGGSTVDTLEYIFSEMGGGTTQRQFNDAVITTISDIEERLTWQNI